MDDDILVRAQKGINANATTYTKIYLEVLMFFN
jgi:hypothetical protein